MNIPLTKPYWGEREAKAVVMALKNSNGTGDGVNTKALVGALQKLTGAAYVLPVTSCTHGLELAMAAMAQTGKLKPGDEVIVPSFTLSATANCVILGAGAKPVLADIDPITYMIDPTDIEKRITKKTRGIILVHYAGMSAPMDKIWKIARRYNLFVVEDAAHAIGAYYKGKPLGTVADIGVYSFHGTKNISCGEGGVVLTDNKELADVMEIYRGQGTNRKQFLEGLIDKYSWVGKGTSFFLSDILSAILVEQIKQIKTINSKRTHIASIYTKVLQPYRDIVQLPIVPKGTTPNWHIYAITFKSPDMRRQFMKAMRAKGIEVSPHYVPLDTSTMGKTLTKGAKALPITEKVSSTLIRLPLYPGLKTKELAYIVQNLKIILNGILP